jgi:hypothetical protein
VNKIADRFFDFPFADAAGPAPGKMQRDFLGPGRRQFSVGREQKFLIGHMKMSRIF